MSMTARHSAVALTTLIGATCLGACPNSHAATVGGVAGERRVVDLTDEEWLAICEWQEGLREGLPLVYTCDSPFRWNWTAEFCMDYGIRFTWTRSEWAPSSDCPLTASELGACVEALASHMCVSGDAFPECVYLGDACPPASG